MPEVYFPQWVVARVVDRVPTGLILRRNCAKSDFFPCTVHSDHPVLSARKRRALDVLALARVNEISHEFL